MFAVHWPSLKLTVATDNTGPRPDLANTIAALWALQRCLRHRPEGHTFCVHPRMVGYFQVRRSGCASVLKVMALKSSAAGLNSR